MAPLAIGHRRTSLDGALGKGVSFTWETGGTSIHSQVVLFAPPHALAWTGQASMAGAIHVFVLTSLSPNRTQVESRESMDGPLLS